MGRDGARHTEAQAARLRRRFRIPLPVAGERAGPVGKITLREREVLGVLATGATNRMIAKRLFISEETGPRARRQRPGEVGSSEPR